MSGTNPNVIREFLVQIGYQEKGKTAFVNSMAGVTADAIKLGLEIKAAALAVTAAVALIASSLESFYFASQRSNASVENIKAFGFAIGQMGGSATEARAALESVGRFLRTNPGGEGFIASLGVSTRDANGKLRDTSGMLTDLGAKLKAMPYYQANTYASVLGIDEKTLIALREGVGQFAADYKAMYQAAGFDAQKAAKDSHLFMNELRLLGGAFEILRDKVGAILARDMTDGIRKFREWLVSNFEKISLVIVWVTNRFVEVGAIVTQMATRLVMSAQEISRWWTTLDDDSKKLIETFGLLGLGVLALNRLFAMSPATAVLGLAFAVWLLWEDYKTWKEGGTSLIDWAKWEPDIEAARKGIIAVKDAIVGLLRAVNEDLSAAFKAISGYDISEWGRGTNRVFDGVKSRIEAITLGLTRLIRLMTAMAKGDLQGIANIASEITTGWLNAAGRAVSGGEAKPFEQADPRTWWERNAPTALGGKPDPRRAGQTGGNPNAGASIDKTAAAKESYDFWRGNGFTPAGAASMVANEQQESGFDATNKTGDGGKSHGLYQHSAERRAAILAQTGIDIDNATAQQQRMATFLEMSRGIDPQSGKAFATIRNAGDTQTAVDAGVDGFERPSDRAGNKVTRNAIAQAWLHKFEGGDQTPPAASAAPAPPATSWFGVPGVVKEWNRPRYNMSAPLLPPSVTNDNSSSNAPTLHQNTTINITGGGPDAGRQVVDSQRGVNQDLIRNMSPAAR